MFKPLKINQKNKIIKINNLILSSSSIDKNFTNLLYSFDFRNGIINNLPSNIIDIILYSKNGINKNLFDSIKTIIQSLIDKKSDNIDQKIIISFLSKTSLLNNPYSLKIQVNQNTFIEKQFILTEQNKFLPVFISINCSELPNLDNIDRFNLIIDSSLEIKNLLIYEFDNYEPKLLISFPHKISNVLFSPFGFQTLKKLKIISEFTLLDTLDFWELQRYMDFTPPNGQSPTYTRYITIKDENVLGTQYDILYKTYDNSPIINNYEFQNVDFKVSSPHSRPVKQFRNKKYKVRTNIKKIQDDPSYNQTQYLFYHGFNKNITLKTGINIGFGNYGTYNWYPVVKTASNISTTFENWISPTFGHNTSRLLPNFIYFHSVGAIINYQYPYNNINQKFQINSLELYEVDENDKRIDITPLISVNNPLLYYLYLPLVKQEPMFNKSFIDIMYDSEFYTNGMVLKYENTIPPLLSEYRGDQIYLDRTIKYYYNQEKQEFTFQSTNDYLLIKNIKDTSPNLSYFHFKVMSTNQTDIIVDFLDSNSNIIYSITVNITNSFTYLYIPIYLYLNSNNIKFIKFTVSNPTLLTIKDLKQIEIKYDRLLLDYLTDTNISTYDYIISTDNISKRGIDWLTTFYGLDNNSITNNSFEQLMLTQNGIHIFKRNLDTLKQGTKYTFYSWIKNNYSGITHQIMTHDNQNYIVLPQTKIIEYDGWELIKTEYIPDRDVNCSYMIFRDYNNYNTDVFIIGVSIFENPYNLPLLNSPSHCYQDTQYLEFSDIYLPTNSSIELNFSHYKYIQDNKSTVIEIEDYNGNSIQFYIQNNEFYSYTNNNSILINTITLSEDKIYKLILNLTQTQIRIQILDTSSSDTIFDNTINHNLLLNNLTKIRLGDSKFNLTDYYSFNFIEFKVLIRDTEP